MNFSTFFSFDGRVSRRTFWISSLILFGFGIALGVLSLILGAVNEVLGQVVYWVAAIPVAWAGLANSVKRWHDRGKSGKWVLIALVPLIGAIWAFVETGFLAGDPAANEYGVPESGSPLGGGEVAYQSA